MIKLLEVYDLRSWDEDIEQMVLVGEANICERCGREHAVVWVIQDDHGKIWHVGSTCAKRLFAGWEPTQKEIKEAKEKFKNRVKAARQAKLDARARPIADQVLSMPVPPPQRLSSESEGISTVERWGDPETGAMIFVHPSFQRITDPERQQTYRRAWYEKKILHLTSDMKVFNRAMEMINDALTGTRRNPLRRRLVI